MSLSAGARLGPYEIVAPLGAGGMGEVYRARDTKLGREVALKIIPDAFAQDHERLARFQREAQVLASLNHQNIAAIYGLEDSTDSTHALVMELVEGPTLAERIDTGAIALSEALPIAAQIAEALEVAHELGIIHRDLKPANIKLRPDGTVKVLDFGLAKAVEGDGFSRRQAEAEASALQITSPAMTLAGMILGTASYMAPEQARGRPVDKRADVWAFGVVLYEMLTGGRAFPGDDVSDTLATVLKFDPDWNRLPAETPASIRRLLKRCLVKDPRLRLRDAGSALLDIQEALAGPEPSPAADAIVHSRSASPFRQSALIATAALLLGAIAGVVGWSMFRGGATDVPQTTRRFTITLPEGDILPLGSGSLLELSPEGRTLAYRARRGTTIHLFRRAIDQFEATMVPGVTNAVNPVVSPDGLWIAFGEGTGTDTVLKKMPIAGGPAQTIATLPAGWRGATWTNDGRILLAVGGSLIAVPAAGGDSTDLFKAGDNLVVTNPQQLTGNSVLVSIRAARSLSGEVVVVRLDSGERKTVQANAVFGRILPTGHLVFLRGGALWAARFDADRLETIGTAVPVIEGVRVEGGGAAQFAIADDGTLAYIPGLAEGTSERLLALVGRDAAELETLKIPARDFINVTLSPDQSRIATQIGDGEDADVWVAEIARGTLTRVTRATGFDGFPMWSQDGKRIVFASSRDGQVTLQSRSADGTGDAVVLATIDRAGAHVVPRSWSADGRTLLFDVDESIGATNADGKAEWKPLRQSAYSPELSPDGRWMAYASNDSGSAEVYLQRYPDAGERRIVSVGGGHTPEWSRDTGELFYLRGGPPNAVMRVSVQSLPNGEVDISAPEVFTAFSFFSRLRGGTAYDVTPDGKRLLVIRLTAEVEPAETVQRINVVVNWHEELKRLVPIR